VAAQSTPDRFVWAVKMLNIDPADQVLEIGCGHGLAVPLVCERLGPGMLTAIDRSKKMIAAALERNRALVDAGRVQFEAVALANADYARHRFSKIFAINVNLFWLDLSPEFVIVRQLLRPGGALYLIYEPPNPAQLKRIADKLARNLEQGGFALDVVMTGRAPSARALCMIASPRRTKR
jgi:SAM-dependent methyltransferase